jgi:3D domain
MDLRAAQAPARECPCPSFPQESWPRLSNSLVFLHYRHRDSEEKHEPVSDIDTVGWMRLTPTGRLEKRPNCCVAVSDATSPKSPTVLVHPAHRWWSLHTGSAIVGPARADIYWGAGDRAAQLASHQVAPLQGIDRALQRGPPCHPTGCGM